MGKDGKFDEEKLKEYFKKMNITYDGSKFKKDGEETPKDETTTDKTEVKFLNEKKNFKLY